MSNYAWVCFDCRERVRRHGRSLNVRCFSCGRPCDCLGYKTRIPPKAKVRDWLALREAVYADRRTWWRRHDAERVQRKHFLEREIEKFEALPSNRERTACLSRLREQLKAVAA